MWSHGRGSTSGAAHGGVVVSSAMSAKCGLPEAQVRARDGDGVSEDQAGASDLARSTGADQGVLVNNR